MLSHIQLFAAPWVIASQAPLFMGFSWQEYLSGLPFPSTENLLNTGIKTMLTALAGLAGRFFTTNTTWEIHRVNISMLYLQMNKLKFQDI